MLAKRESSIDICSKPRSRYGSSLDPHPPGGLNGGVGGVKSRPGSIKIIRTRRPKLRSPPTVHATIATKLSKVKRQR